jgi:galactokinase
MDRHAAAAFERLFGKKPEVRARAPGRVNLVGEHTDYNGGFVLPMTVPQETEVLLARSPSPTVRAWSAELTPAEPPERYVLGSEARGRGWVDYVQGVTAVLARDGHQVSGFDVAIRSRVPVGSGLSSSAALEVSLLRALREAFTLPLDDLALALVGQRVETEFVGAPVGVMDQMASSLGDAHAALFIDTRTLHHERVALPSALELLVIASGVSHSHAGGDYRVRRAECERAASLLGLAQLRDLPEAELARADVLPEPLGRRVRHVVTETARVLRTVAALRSGDLAALRALLGASHASQRDLFEVSVPEIERLVSLAGAEPDVFGARLTGGGFGGSIVALVSAGRAASVGARVTAAYRDREGREAILLVPDRPAVAP